MTTQTVTSNFTGNLIPWKLTNRQSTRRENTSNTPAPVSRQDFGLASLNIEALLAA